MVEKPVIFIVSDSVGETADLVTRAALAQWGRTGVEIRRFPMVDDSFSLREVVDAARQQPTLIVYTIIVPEIRQELQRLVEMWNIPSVDIMGPMLEEMSKLLGAPEKLEPGRMHRLDDEYFRRIEAVEFAVKYDDGKDPRGFLRADAVLIGVSRSSKTPVSMYLAHRRYKVANLPLVPEVSLPKELFLVPPHKVVGLRVSPEKLHQIREERVKTIGLRSDANYSSMARILQELDYAESVFKKVGCAVIDVTNKAVEETAVRVLEIINRGVNFGD
ncbi:pyruvate, water dikinase regulatory protein [Symbiobacterium terraclitae]|uniref:pyruvate, water dikinase regulatory protein n=1 Tax=Symbiobacterium terraclitae TaxID=557451 RepID=UPI0035B516BE